MLKKHEVSQDGQFVVGQKLCGAACLQVHCNFQAPQKRAFLNALSFWNVAIKNIFKNWRYRECMCAI